MFLLDTNVLSELRKTRPHGALLAWYGIQARYSLFVPSVALYEMQAGVEITRHQDVAKAKELEEWIDRLVVSSTVLELNAKSARTAAKFLHGKPPELLEDAMIAAIAATNGLTVATRNMKDFEQFSVPAVNPFMDTRA